MDTNKTPPEGLAEKKKPRLTAMERLAIETGLDAGKTPYANFHQGFMRGKVTIVGCPKLDPVDYSEKLTEILRENDIKSLTIVRMEVPCCGGLEMAAKRRLRLPASSSPGRS